VPVAVPPDQQALREHVTADHHQSGLLRLAAGVRRRQNDDRPARSPDTPLRHRRDRQRQLALQEPRLTPRSPLAPPPRPALLRYVRLRHAGLGSLRRGRSCKRKGVGFGCDLTMKKPSRAGGKPAKARPHSTLMPRAEMLQNPRAIAAQLLMTHSLRSPNSSASYTRRWSSRRYSVFCSWHASNFLRCPLFSRGEKQTYRVRRLVDPRADLAPPHK
jgi:hypothetical protein